MDFESPDVEKDFPGLYASETIGKSQERDVHYSDEEKVSKKELLIGKLKDKKDKKDKGYVAFEGESSDGEMDESKGKGKKSKASFKFPGKEKKEKTLKSKDSKEGLKSKESKESKKDVDRESKDAKKKKESKVKLGRKKKKQEHEKDEKPLFGVPLLTALELNPSHDGIELPAIVRECIDYIEEHGMTCEGIYRMSGVKSKVQQLRACYNRHEPVCLSEHGPHVVASLLKQFLRELPDPVLTSELSPKFEDAAGIKDETKRVEAIQRLIEQLPVPNRCLLSWVFVHMTNVIRLEKHNKMNLQNVSIVLSPSMQISHRVLHALFSHASIFFKDVHIKKYARKIQADSSRQSLDLPETPAAIEEELSHQEQVLNEIHAELNTGLRDPQKEEQLWEVQRVVTQLKRKEDVAGSGEMHATGDLKEDTFTKLSTEVAETEFVTPLETKISEEDTDPEVRQLKQDERVLLLQQEELLSLGDELRRKIAAERTEMERLRSEISEYQKLAKYKQYSVESAECSSSGTEGSESEGEDELKFVLSQLMDDNKQLSQQAMELSQKILKEREACVDLKVKMRLLQNEAKALNV